MAAEYKMYAPNLVCVCVRSREDDDYAGSIWNQYDEAGCEFRGLADMVRQMELWYDRWNFPQRSTYVRSFADDAVHEMKKSVLGERNQDWMPAEKGALGTFVIHVKYRQNATWQGEAVWVEGQEKITFLSVLELLKWIDRSLQGGAA